MNTEKTLAPLAKVRKQEERVKQADVLKRFAEEYPFDTTCAVEIKIKNRPLKPHQETALGKVLCGLHIWKHPDMGRRNPFDATLYKNANTAVIRVYGRDCVAVIHRRNLPDTEIRFRM